MSKRIKIERWSDDMYKVFSPVDGSFIGFVYRYIDVDDKWRCYDINGQRIGGPFSTFETRAAAVRNVAKC